MLVTTHVSNLTGTIFPVEEIGKISRKHGLLYLLDASQSAGLLNIDLKKFNIDFLAAPGHKGLLGPQGTGILLINNDIDLKQLKEGGTGSQSSSFEQPNFYPDKLEAGTHNLPGIAGLNAGIKYILNRGLESIYSHEKNLLYIHQRVEENPKNQYRPKPIDHRASLLLFVGGIFLKQQNYGTKEYK